MSTLIYVLLSFGAVITAVVLWLLGAFNRLVALDERCETAFADVDVHLKHRQNLLPGLVETVKGYAAHERDIFLGVAQAQAEAVRAGPEARMKAEKNLSQSITQLLQVAKQFPELQASRHFCQLRDDLMDAENRITASRRFYNLAVQEYSATARQFPGNVIIKMKPMAPRSPYDLGIERIMIDEPLAFKF